MKFTYGDEIDKSLVKVIIHEFSRCQIAFEMFASLKSLNYKKLKITESKFDLMVYNAYALFIQHLYEYFKGCIVRDRNNTANIPSNELDVLVNFEVEKILNIWRTLIDIGNAPPYANSRSYYEDNVPEDFGKEFRNIRNNLAHVDYRRIDGGNRVTLTEFYNRYHKYIMLMYYNGLEWWNISKFNDLDLGDITEFNKLT